AKCVGSREGWCGNFNLLAAARRTGPDESSIVAGTTMVKPTVDGTTMSDCYETDTDFARRMRTQ
ncbi:MAG: hypothetical protein ACRDU0_20565, partial [Mycobacterium sp.]